MLYIILGVIALFIVLFVISTYNGLVSAREFVRNSMGQIATQVESRWDVVKNLIQATKEYSAHEANVLTQITEARAKVNKDSSVEQVERDDQAFSQAIRNINVVAENYPDLKASQVYINTMNSIDKYENNVRSSRMIYNDTVTKLNRKIQQFPSNIVAGLFGFTQESYFTNTPEKSDMPSW